MSTQQSSQSGRDFLHETAKKLESAANTFNPSQPQNVGRMIEDISNDINQFKSQYGLSSSGGGGSGGGGSSKS